MYNATGKPEKQDLWWLAGKLDVTNKKLDEIIKLLKILVPENSKEKQTKKEQTQDA